MRSAAQNDTLHPLIFDRHRKTVIDISLIIIKFLTSWVRIRSGLAWAELSFWCTFHESLNVLHNACLQTDKPNTTDENTASIVTELINWQNKVYISSACIYKMSVYTIYIQNNHSLTESDCFSLWTLSDESYQISFCPT